MSSWELHVGHHKKLSPRAPHPSLSAPWKKSGGRRDSLNPAFLVWGSHLRLITSTDVQLCPAPPRVHSFTPGAMSRLSPCLGCKHQAQHSAHLCLSHIFIISVASSSIVQSLWKAWDFWAHRERGCHPPLVYTHAGGSKHKMRFMEMRSHLL